LIRGGLFILWDAPPDEDLLPLPPDRRDRCLIFDGLITFSDVIDGILVALEFLPTNRSSSKPLAMVYTEHCVVDYVYGGRLRCK